MSPHVIGKEKALRRRTQDMDWKHTKTPQQTNCFRQINKHNSRYLQDRRNSNRK